MKKFNEKFGRIIIPVLTPYDETEAVAYDRYGELIDRERSLRHAVGDGDHGGGIPLDPGRAQKADGDGSEGRSGP